MPAVFCVHHDYCMSVVAELSINMWKLLVIANILIVVIASMPGAYELLSARKMFAGAGSAVKERLQNGVNVINFKDRPEIQVIVPVMRMTEKHPEFKGSIKKKFYALFRGLPFEKYKADCLSDESRSWVESIEMKQGVYTGCVIQDVRDPLIRVKDGWGVLEAYLQEELILETFHNYIYQGYWKNNVPDGLGHGYIMDEYRLGKFLPAFVVTKVYSCNFFEGENVFAHLVGNYKDSSKLMLNLELDGWILYKKGNIGLI